MYRTLLQTCVKDRTNSVKNSDLEYLKSFLRTELLKKDSKIQLPRSVTKGLEAYVSLSHEVNLQCPIDWFVLIGNSVKHYFKSDD